MSETVLVLAVHPDDETLGCGGTIAKHIAKGDSVHWCIVTAVNEAEGWPAEMVERREKEIEAVANLYSFDGVHRLNFPTMRLDELPLGDLVQAMGDVVKAVEPSTVYLPFPGDVHSDHRVAFEAGFSCAKWFRYPSVLRVLAMETQSETDFAPALPGQGFMPNVFEDVSEHFARKQEVMALFAGELGEHPFPRSARGMEALATLRGAACGVEYAEAFMLLREVRK